MGARVRLPSLEPPTAKRHNTCPVAGSSAENVPSLAPTNTRPAATVGDAAMPFRATCVRQRCAPSATARPNTSPACVAAITVPSAMARLPRIGLPVSTTHRVVPVSSSSAKTRPPSVGTATMPPATTGWARTGPGGVQDQAGLPTP
jgi:hypothetical protein